MFKIIVHLKHPVKGILQADVICFPTPHLQRETENQVVLSLSVTYVIISEYNLWS